MGKKKVKEYKSGDFIFAKVKGYPAWPARVQRRNGNKYIVLFYGTGETANLPPTMIFDYIENKRKFLTKTVKRRDFNDGVKQIEFDVANNVPLSQAVELNSAVEFDSTNNVTMDTSVENPPDVTITNQMEANTSQSNIGADDEEYDPFTDEAKSKGKRVTSKTPVKEPKTPKTPRGKVKKEDDEIIEKKEEELVSRSGRKIRPKRYMDEHVQDNATLPSPAPKKRRPNSPTVEKEKQDSNTTIMKHFKNIPQAELENITKPFKLGASGKDNILIAYLPSGQYIGIKLFQSRPAGFATEAARLQWDKQAAANAITLKTQLERGHVTTESIIAQLVMDLHLTDEERATLDMERETEGKKSRVQFLKTEMRLIELDTKIKTCLCLEKANTELCIEFLVELMKLDVNPLMLLKHPSCLETLKRIRAYVGNTPSWDLSESDGILFSKHAHQIRKLADTIYNKMKKLFTSPPGLPFWEFFSERVVQFRNATFKLTSDELMELIHEPLELSQPTSHTMKTSVEAANECENEFNRNQNIAQQKKIAKNAKPTVKRQASKNQEEIKEEQKDEEKVKDIQKMSENHKVDSNSKDKEGNSDKEKITETDKQAKIEKKEITENSENSEQDADVNGKKQNEEAKSDKKNDDSMEKADDETPKDTYKIEEQPKSTPEKPKSSADLKDGEKTKDAMKKDLEKANDKKDSDISKSDKRNLSMDVVSKNISSEEKLIEINTEDEPRVKRIRVMKKTEQSSTLPTKRKRAL